jgi:SAM-dependent methyltransferase
VLDHVAISRATYADDGLVGEMTRSIVERGSPILQSHKLAAPDRVHVARLLDFYGFPRGAEVLDAGCGTGAVAALMSELRPDLRFTLLNVSGGQLQMAPAGMKRVLADTQEMPFAPGTFDGVMFNYVLGHTDIGRSLSEAARVLRGAGVCGVYDLISDEPEHVVERVGYRPHSVEEIMDAAGGFTFGDFRKPADFTTEDFEATCGPDALVEHGFDRARPILYRLVK